MPTALFKTLFFSALAVGTVLSATASSARAQLPPPALQREMQESEPTLSDQGGFTPNKLEQAHWKVLTSIYPESVLNPLCRKLDPGARENFPTALAKARAANVPDGILAEAEILRALSDGNFPTLAATAGRLQNAEAYWQEKTSLFYSREMAQYTVAVVNATISRERAEPGVFAKAAATAKKRELARRVLSDLRVVDSSSDLYALHHNFHANQVVSVDQWLTNVPADHHLRTSGGLDLLGHPFGPQTPGVFAAVPTETYRTLSDVVPDSFWGRYNFPGKAPQ